MKRLAAAVRLFSILVTTTFIGLMTVSCQEEGAFFTPVVPPTGGCPAGIAGIAGIVGAARTADGFTGSLSSAALPVGAAPAAILNHSIINGTAGGPATITVGYNVPITDILLGRPGEAGYLDINVTPQAAQRQQFPPVPSYSINLTLAQNLCDGQFSVVIKDAAGNFTLPVTVSLASTTGTAGNLR